VALDPPHIVTRPLTPAGDAGWPAPRDRRWHRLRDPEAPAATVVTPSVFVAVREEARRWIHHALRGASEPYLE
jgi:hypothetical protein